MEVSMRSVYLFIASLILSLFICRNGYADTAYVIKKGDNPCTIAKKFRVRSQDIIKANRLNPDNLKPGMRITIPSRKKKAPPQEISAKTKTAQQMKENDAKIPDHHSRNGHLQDNASFHAVKRGDTLSSIARKHSVSIRELKEINRLKSSKLRTGQRLVIRHDGIKDYTVKKGDTLWKIAKRFDIDPDELKGIKGFESESLKPGQKILLTAPEAKEPRTYEAFLSEANGKGEPENFSEEAQAINQLGTQERLVTFAKKLLDIPYRFGGNSLLGIDCSAYVKKVYSLIGVALPRSAREQFQEGEPVDEKDLSIGDLVFFRTYASFPSHVGIYLGNNLFIHASSRSKKVTIDSLDTPYYFKRFIGAKRLLDVRNENQETEKEG
jgi:cell wall-associated NlpC family hydrolase